MGLSPAGIWAHGPPLSRYLWDGCHSSASRHPGKQNGGLAGFQTTARACVHFLATWAAERIGGQLTFKQPLVPSTAKLGGARGEQVESTGACDGILLAGGSSLFRASVQGWVFMIDLSGVFQEARQHHRAQIGLQNK